MSSPPEPTKRPTSLEHEVTFAQAHGVYDAFFTCSLTYCHGFPWIFIAFYAIFIIFRMFHEAYGGFYVARSGAPPARPALHSTKSTGAEPYRPGSYVEHLPRSSQVDFYGFPP